MSEDLTTEDAIEEIPSIQELEVIVCQVSIIEQLMKIDGNYDAWEEDRIRMLTSCKNVIIEANKSIISWLKDESK